MKKVPNGNLGLDVMLGIILDLFIKHRICQHENFARTLVVVNYLLDLKPDTS